MDYERLLRFKTAKVKMHVQPYKYKYNETAVVQNLTGSSGTFTVTNSGNTDAAPTIDIIGSGTVSLSVAAGSFEVDMSDDAEVIVDTEGLETYYGTVLKNRLVTGNISRFRLAPGNNTITWDGAITKLTISKYSRWI